MPATMMPMFSIDEYASSRFMSVCTVAKMTPKSAVSETERERDHAPPPELAVAADRT